MSIHAMSDDEFEDFERDSVDSELTQWDDELSCTVESRNEWIESGLLHLSTPDDPEDEDNYDDTCELNGLADDMPHPEDIGFDPETDCENPF